MEQKEVIEVTTETGNYIVLKQELDGGFVGSLFVLIFTVTVSAMLLRWAWTGFH